MATRHRIPSIFNLSMVDVLCCALGCVILLWLLNLRQAKQSGHELTTTQIALADKIHEAEDIYDRLRTAEKERDDVRLVLASSRSRVTQLDADLANLRIKRVELEEDIARRTKTQAAQSKDLAEARQRGDGLDAALRKKEAQYQTASRSAQALEDRLREADDEAKKLRAQAETLGTRTARLEKDLDARARDLAGTTKSLQEMDNLRLKFMRDLAARDRDLAASALSLDQVRGEKLSLQKQASRMRAERDSRFAGIALTGRNVVFLVDMSGSMELIDPRTADPNKWAGVRETLAKVMKSLPALEKFQVILFSDKVLFPLGKEGEWIDYEGAASADFVLQTLADKKYKPKGGTNMFTALEATFRLRPGGLDTVYLFSDGLPNQGRGLTPEQTTLTEMERGEILGKFIRKTLSTDWNRPLEGKARVRINAIGFYYESPDVGAFLWALVRDNDGSFVGMSKP